MEKRLTFEGNFCDISMCRENPCPYNGSCSQKETWERLKYYEDLEAQGRLVILPCNDHAELVRDGETYQGDHWNHTLSAFRDDPTTRSGRRVALFSIEEAKRALEDMKGGGDGNG